MEVDLITPRKAALRGLIWVLVVLIALLRTASAAQTGAGQIRGIIQDVTKALLPGVTLTLTNTGTGTVATQVSNETGGYQFVGVTPGTYRLTALLPGFRQAAINELEVGTNVQLRYDFTLEVGAQATTIEVSAQSDGRVLTEGASVGVVLPSDQLTALPLVSGNVLELLSVLPGYRESALGGAFDTVGGLGLNSVNATLNGLSTNSTRDSAELWGRAQLTTTTINPDLVGEIRLILAPVDAELGRGNSQVQIQTRAGTNKYTGSVVWNVQNSAFSANTWDNNNNVVNGRWQPTPVPWTNRHQVSASYSGPVIRNKTFFYVLYDQQFVRQRELVTTSVLTDSAREGIFRYFSGWNPGNALTAVPATFTGQVNGSWPSVNFDGAPVAPTRNPDGSAYSGGLNCFSVFGNVKADGSPFGPSDCPGGTAVSRDGGWDTRRTTFDSTGYIRKVLDLMPRANYFATGDGLNTAGYQYLRGRKGSNSTNASVGVVNSLIDQGNRKQLNIRIDENINARHKVGVNWQYQMEDSTDNIAAWDTGLSGTIKRRPQILTVNATSTLSSRLVNEARFGMNRSMEQSAPAWNHPTNSEVRQAAIDLLPVAGASASGFAYRTRFSPIYNGYMGGIAGAFDFWNVSPLFNYADTVTWSHGKHSFRVGAEVRLPRTKGFNGGAWPTVGNGLSGTAPDYTTSLTVYQNELPLLRQNTRNNLASLIYFLNGSISTVTHSYWIDGVQDIKNGAWEDVSTSGFQTRSQLSTEWNLFFKDDWKITRRLTLNVGLRYDYFGSPYLANGLTSATKDRGAGIYGVGRPRNGDLLSQWLQPGDLYLSGYGTNPRLANGTTLTPLTCSNSIEAQAGLPTPNCDPSLLSTLEFVGPKTDHPDKSLLPAQGAWGPALGFSWQLPWFGEGKTSIRGGWQRTRGGAGASIQPGVYGLDGGDTTSGTLANHINDANLVAITGTRALNLSDLPVLVPSSPTRVAPGSAIPIAGRTRGLTDYDPSYVNPHTDNITLSLTRTLSRGLSLDSRYVGTFGRKLRGSINLNTLNVFHNAELFDALERTRAGEDVPLFDYLLQGLNLNSGIGGAGLGYAAIGTTPTSGPAAGVLQRGSAHLRRAQASNLADGSYLAVVNAILALAAGTTPGFQTAATLPAGVTQAQRVIRNGCDRLANGLTTVNLPGGPAPARCFAENYFTANPQLTTANMNANFGRSNSHSFQSTLTMRPKAGLSFSGTFTWDKIMTLPGSGYTDPLNRELDYAASVSSNPMGFRANGTFELPIGPNKLMFASSSGWVARLLERWQTAFIVSTSSGAPRTVASGEAVGLYNNYRPDVVGPWTNPRADFEWIGNRGYYFGNPSPYATFLDPQCQSLPTTDSMRLNLQTSCTLRGLGEIVPADTPGAILQSDGRYILPLLQQPRPGKPGTLGATTMRSLPRWNLSANISKQFRISESVRAQLRIDSTNVMNHPVPSEIANSTFNMSNENFGTTNAKGGRSREFTAQLRLNF